MHQEGKVGMRNIACTLSATVFVVAVLASCRTDGAGSRTRSGDCARNVSTSAGGGPESCRAEAAHGQDLGTYATNIWKTVSSYIPRFEHFATNNKHAAWIANVRATRLETWRRDMTNDLLLASATNGLKSSAYFTATNAQLASTIATLALPVAASSVTNAVVAGYVCTPAGAADMANEAVERKLQGRVFDFSDVKGLYVAMSNVVSAMGGSVTNFPSFKE